MSRLMMFDRTSLSMSVLRRGWIYLLLLCILCLGLFFETITMIVKGWFTYSASHGFLIFALSLFMIWKKRAYLAGLELRPSVVYGALLTGLGCLMLISGRLSGTASLEKISLIVILLGLVLHLGGPKYFKALYVPICYLIFTFSVFDTIFSSQLIYLQKATAWIAANLLGLTGLPVFRSGEFITLPHIGLNVSTACSGINQISALVGLAVPLALATQRTRWQRVLLVVEAFGVGILANGLRVAGIGLWTYFNKHASAHGPSDVLLVSFTFGIGFIVLVFLAAIQGKISFKGIVNKPLEKKMLQAERPSQKAYLAFITGAIILVAAGSYLFLLSGKPLYLEGGIKEIPSVIGNWVREDVYQGTVKLDTIRPDSEFRATYHNEGQGKIHVYVGYFAKQTREKKVFMSEYARFRENAVAMNLSQDPGARLMLNYRKTSRGDAYLGYIIGGKVISQPYMAKLSILQNALLKGRSNAGIVIIETEGNVFAQGDEQGVSRRVDFVKDIVPRVVSNMTVPKLK